MTFKTGSQVMITCEGRTVPGEVTLASANGKSLILSFEAILDGFVGCMPVMVRDDGSMCSLASRTAIVLRERPEP